MPTTTAKGRSVAKKKGGEVRRYNTLVRMDDEVAEAARKIAALRNISVGEYVSAIVGPAVRADMAKEAEKLARESKGEQ